MPEVRKLRVIGNFNEGTVKSVNGTLPDQNGNVTVDVSTIISENDALAVLLECNALPTLVDKNGAILTDKNGAILLG